MTSALAAFACLAAAKSMPEVPPKTTAVRSWRVEGQLGLSLFSRTTHSLTLGPQGRDLHERALRLLR